jgi:flagellar biogenesis protein FliO
VDFTQVLEAMTISLIITLVIVAVYIVRIKYRKKVKVLGPFAYKLDESGVPEEISADSIPSEVSYAVREKILKDVARTYPAVLKKNSVLVFAMMIFIIQLIVLLWL